MTLTPLAKETIFERRREAARDRWLLLAALVGGQFFFIGGAVDLWLHLYAPDKVQHGWRYGLGLAVLLTLSQALAARLRSTWDLKARVGGIPPDPRDARHQAFAQAAQDAALAAGLTQVQVFIAQTAAMNAFGWLDEQGRPVIGITEGLLGRLEPAESTAIAAQEAAHLAYGDVGFFIFAGSVISLFDLSALGVDLSDREQSQDVLTLGVVTGLIYVWALALPTRLIMGWLFRAFVRGRKRNADAAAVAMTRDPLALAQTLTKAARGGDEGFRFSVSYRPLLLVSGPDDVDASQGELKRRLQWLVSDAGQSLRHLQLRLAQQQTQEAAPREPRPQRWWLWQAGAWTGPLSLQALRANPTYSGESWVCSEGGAQVQRASADGDLVEHQGIGACPRCRALLGWRKSLGLRLQHCPNCDGHFVPADLLQRLIARPEERFSLSIYKRALRLRRAERRLALGRPAEASGYPPMRCPACGAETRTQFLNHLARVPVDRCQAPSCGGIWLDGGELELVQLLSEQPALGMDLDHLLPVKGLPPDKGWT